MANCPHQLSSTQPNIKDIFFHLYFILSGVFELHPPKCCYSWLAVVLLAKEVFAQIIQTPVATFPVVDNWVQNDMMWYRCCQFNTGQLLFSCFTRTLLFSDQSLILPFEKLVHWAFIRLDILCYQDWFDWQARIFCAHPLEFWPFSGSGSRCLPGAVPSLKAPTSRRANVGFGVWPSKFADDRPTCVLCMQETADAIVPRNWPHRPGNAS